MVGLLACLSPASGGPWVHPPGDWYAKLGYSAFRSGAYVDPAGRATASPMLYRGNIASAYVEAGVVRGVEVVAELPYVWASNRFPASALRYRAASLGAARLGVGLSWPALRVPASLRVGVRVPLYPAGGRLPLDPAPGEQQVDLEAVAGIGASPALADRDLRVWGLAEIGARHRTGATLVSDPEYVGVGGGLTYHAQLGVVPGRGWVAVESAGQLDLAVPRSAHQLGLGVAIPVWGELHAELGLSDTWRARGASTGWGFSAGVSHVHRKE